MIPPPRSRRIATWACDQAYAGWTLSSIESFRRWNPTWAIELYDVGIDHDYLEAFHDIPGIEVIESDPCLKGPGHYPSSRVRCQMLADLEPGDTLLYLDSDLLSFSPVEELVTRFEQSGLGFACYREDDPRWNCNDMESAWTPRLPPVGLYRNAETWLHKPILNTGVVFARGPVANEVGQQQLAVYNLARPFARWAEQTLFGSAIYDLGHETMRLQAWEHCLIPERLVRFPGPTATGFLDGPSVDGRKVIFRHYAGCKHLLQKRIDNGQV